MSNANEVNNAGLATNEIELTDAGWEMTMAVWYDSFTPNRPRSFLTFQIAMLATSSSLTGFFRY